jgi:hypothetical protein
MPKTLPTLYRLNEVLEYFPDTGNFTSRVKRGSRAMPGTVAGSLKVCGRVILQVDGVEYKAHRLAWLMFYGEEPTSEIDHINRIQSDNRISNLRCVSHRENMLNRGMPKNNTSGHVGVHWFVPTSRWKASITVDGKERSLGYFISKEEAIERRLLAEQMYRSKPL